MQTPEDEYLAQRKISHELNSPAMTMLKEHFAENPPEMPVAPPGEEAPKAPTNTTAEGPERPSDPLAAKHGTGYTGEPDEPLKWPDFNPITDFILGGTTAVGLKAIRGGAKLFPTLARYLTAGGVTSAASYPIEAGTRAVAGESAWAIPASLALSLLSAGTFEATAIRAVENAMAKRGAGAAADAATAAQKAISNYKAGKEDEFTEPIMREMRTAVEETAAETVVSRRGEQLVSITDEEAAQFLAQGTPKEFDKYGSAGGNINFDRISSPDDVRAAYEKTQRVFGPKIDAARRGVIDNEQTKLLADDMGMTVEQLLSRREGQAFNHVEAVAARKLLVSSAQQLDFLAKKVASKTATDIDKFNFQKQLTLHEAIQEQVSGMTAEAGRALQSFNIPVNADKKIMSQLDELAEATVVLSKRVSQTGVESLMAMVESIKKEVC